MRRRFACSRPDIDGRKSIKSTWANTAASTAWRKPMELLSKNTNVSTLPAKVSASFAIVNLALIAVAEIWRVWTTIIRRGRFAAFSAASAINHSEHSETQSMASIEQSNTCNAQPKEWTKAKPEELQKFSTGAVRSRDREGERYDLISPIGLRRLARTCHEGAIKYSDFSWERGMPIHDILNHAIAHLYQYLSGDRSEDHLAHTAWNCFAAMHSEELWPHLNEGRLRRAGCVAPSGDYQDDRPTETGTSETNPGDHKQIKREVEKLEADFESKRHLLCSHCGCAAHPNGTPCPKKLAEQLPSKCGSKFVTVGENPAAGQHEEGDR